ncbi:hypothetical protein F5Y14DRAFT_417689 [Nemania sp. NC0429]|nr:hypothetical protein F5Y14DRAFT_417689 [Nemania sp. NC0429]
MATRASFRLQINAVHILLTSLLIASSSAETTSQFQNFYPQHGDKYEYILHHNCSLQFANYLTGRPLDFTLDWLGGAGEGSVLTQPVVECLLKNISEYIKAASSAAQVILGVTPPLLATLGASAEELAMLNVVGRRPLLALLISVGSPSVYMERVFEFRQPETMLHYSPGQYRPVKPDTMWKQRLFVMIQYLVAIGAAANVVTLSWQLGVRTVCSWWSNTVFAPLVWTILCIPIHVAGTFALRLRVRRVYSDEEKSLNIRFRKWLRLLPKRLHDYWESEWVPAVTGDEIRTVHFEEGSVYIAWSWLLSVATVIHILYGSLLLSGLLFIGPRDALLIVFRYVVSVLVCRILIRAELAGMRSRYVAEPKVER